MALNKKYSYNTWKRRQFLTVSPMEFNNSEIIGACFYQEDHHSDVFPAGVTGVTFTRCNLDNCKIPAGCIVVGGTNQHIASQNDMEYWVVDTAGKPLAPRDTAKFDKCGLSKLPNDIPAEMVAEPVTVTNDPDWIKARTIEEIKADPARLEQILTDAGEI